MKFSLIVVLFIAGIWYGGYKYGIMAQDNQQIDMFAMLSGTLRTYQRAGCDNDIVTLKCPTGTSISVQIAQYGKSTSSKGLCNSTKSTSTDVAPNIAETTVCLLPDSLQTVIELCQKKQQCFLQISPTVFGGDPCPGLPKYLEIAYNCRPSEFRSITACQNEKIQLRCNAHLRIAIYDANYGRTQYESVLCSPHLGLRDESCMASYATETVMSLCHGKRSCDIMANADTFGSPCKRLSKTYLKVIYTCVPRQVLKDSYKEALGPDEIDGNQEDEFDSPEGVRDKTRQITTTTVEPKSTKKNSTIVQNKSAETIVTFGQYFEIYKRDIIYIVIGFVVGLLILAGIFVARILYQRRNQPKDDSTYYNATTTDHNFPNGFSDNISEVDADIDLHTIPQSTTVKTVAEVVPYPQYAEYPNNMYPNSHVRSFHASPMMDLKVPTRPTRVARGTGINQYYCA